MKKDSLNNEIIVAHYFISIIDKKWIRLCSLLIRKSMNFKFQEIGFAINPWVTIRPMCLFDLRAAKGLFSTQVLVQSQSIFTVVQKFKYSSMS